MWLLYLLALILGGGILLVQLLAGSDGHHGLDHGRVDATHPYEGPGLLSVRSAMYGLFTFGVVGGVAARAGPGPAGPARWRAAW